MLCDFLSVPILEGMEKYLPEHKGYANNSGIICPYIYNHDNTIETGGEGDTADYDNMGEYCLLPIVWLF